MTWVRFTGKGAGATGTTYLAEITSESVTKRDNAIQFEQINGTGKNPSNHPAIEVWV